LPLAADAGSVTAERCLAFAMPLLFLGGQEEPETMIRLSLQMGTWLFNGIGRTAVKVGRINAEKGVEELSPTRVAFEFLDERGRCEVEFEAEERAREFAADGNSNKLKRQKQRVSGAKAPTTAASASTASAMHEHQAKKAKTSPKKGRGDDFGSIGLKNNLPSVGSHAPGSQVNQSWASKPAPQPTSQSTQGRRLASSGPSGGTLGPLPTFRAEPFLTTPQPAQKFAGGLRDFDEDVPESLWKDLDERQNRELAEKRRTLDPAKVGTLGAGSRFDGRHTPEKHKSSTRPQRATPMHTNSAVDREHFSLSSRRFEPWVPQSSSSYSGYRSTAVFGLRNLGNTCYLNAVMQACGAMREFVRELAKMPEQIETCRDGPLFGCAVEILQQLSAATPHGPLSPGKLREQIAKASPMFGSSEQQDAHEFFLEYINQLHDELLASRGRWLEERGDFGGPAFRASAEDTVVATQAHLDSAVEKRLECVECHQSRTMTERFRDFSIDFEEGDRSASCSLASMLRSYFAPEELEATCAHCDHPAARMEKRLSIPPRVLVLHLKRFVPNLQLHRYDKRHQSVEFPQRFDLQECLRSGAHSSIAGVAASNTPRLPARPLAAFSPEQQEPHQSEEKAAAAPPPLYYNLRALVSHDGASPHSGHYVCYAKSESGMWKLYDDSIVRDLGSAYEPHRELGRSAYILFYVLES